MSQCRKTAGNHYSVESTKQEQSRQLSAAAHPDFECGEVFGKEAALDELDVVLDVPLQLQQAELGRQIPRFPANTNKTNETGAEYSYSRIEQAVLVEANRSGRA